MGFRKFGKHTHYRMSQVMIFHLDKYIKNEKYASQTLTGKIWEIL